MARASTLRARSGSFVCASMRVPSSQSSVSNRPVDSFGPRFRHAHDVDAIEHQRGKARRAWPRAGSRALRARARRSPCRSRWCRSRNRGGAGWQGAIAIARRSASTADCMSGYCSLQASAAPSSERARCTWPSDAAAAGWCSKLANFSCQSEPSSALMRRLTKAQPIGGASLCSFCNSAAYSGGNRSGMVAINWATFISGPLRLPSAEASAEPLRRRGWARRREGAGRHSARLPARHWRRHAHSARRGRRSGFSRGQPSSPLSILLFLRHIGRNDSGDETGIMVCAICCRGADHLRARKRRPCWTLGMGLRRHVRRRCRSSSIAANLL